MSSTTDRAGDATRSPDDWKRIFALLDRALELDDDGRTTWMASLAASGDPDATAAQALLEQRATMDARAFATARPGPGAAPVRPDAGSDDVRVGPYRLLREIGRGGTSTVWLAERCDGLVARRVALKRPDVSWHRGSVFADRMTRERSIVASLTHPHIARLYDAGIEADGRPYLALEYIDGVAIDRYAEQRDLSMRERVRLIRDVARAVGYAHGQLVVHRDLKPSNLLVDHDGTVHLVDFGIAKLIDPGPEPAGAGSPPTMMAGRALTPDYASPEQIRGDAIGTASDVYSLGVVAFELFAGVRPYCCDAQSDPGSLARRHAPLDIPRASDVATGADRAKQLRGDLNAVLRKMLAALPADRYATMDALADDLDRYLSGEPVSARSASRGYVLRRWVGRHRLESGIGVAVVVAVFGHLYAQVLIALAIAAGGLVAIWQRDRARQQAALARAALERGEQVKNFIASIFTQAVPRIGKGGTVAATDLLKAAARRVETDLAGQPAVAAELGVVIGSSFNELGDLQAAMAWLPKAIDLCERHFGPAHPLTLRAQQRLVVAANTTGDLARSRSLLPSLLRHLRKLQATEPQLLVEALRSHAFVLAKGDHADEALAALREAIEVAVAHAGEASELALLTRESLANTFGHFGRHAEALEAIEQALAPAYALFGAQRPHPLLTAVERGHGDALAMQRPRDATLILRQVVADQRALDVVETTRVRVATHMLARALTHRGHYDEGTALFGEALAMQQRLGERRSSESVKAFAGYALALGLRGDGAAALAAVEPAFAAMPDGSEGRFIAPLAFVSRALAEVVLDRNEAALASIDAACADGVAQPPTVSTRMIRIRCIAQRQSGAVDAARALASSTLAGLDATCIALEHGLLHVEAARCARALDRPADAARHWREALHVWDDGQVDGDELRRPLVAEFATG